MFELVKLQKPLLITSGALFLALVTSVFLMPKATLWLEEWGQSKLERRLTQAERQPSGVFPLVSLPAKQREIQLQEIANTSPNILERSRARYLLAADLIARYEGGPALRQLEGLKEDYPQLAPYILLKQGRGHELSNEPMQAQTTWKQLLKDYPDSPAVVEALYYLGRYDAKYWERAIAEFPQHPRSIEIARERLKKNPQQLNLLRLLAKYAPTDLETKAIRDRLVKDYAQQLTPGDWEAIATGYWERGEYGKAAPAYAKAPPTPRNRYRAARGLQLDGQSEAAKAAYQRMIKAFPRAEETGLALRRLASLSPPKPALSYLNRVIAQFPKEAPAALVQKAKLLDARDPKAAAQARKTLLKRYPNSDAAAEYRWQMAEKFAATGDLIKAWQWAQPITSNNPESDLAPKAGFWVGKWAEKLGRSREAKKAFQHVLGKHPQSYYAWRSAVHLGWPVGDFTSLRQLTPVLDKPVGRPRPPAGSATFQELYHLGQDGDAWRLFQAETAKQEELTVEEQFTEALLKLNRGHNLAGINQIWGLKEQKTPAGQQQWQELRQTSEYWHSLFPFPFYNLIVNWSQQRQLNPLLVTSLIRQESRFEPEIRSPVGATGLMQVMPATGQWIAEKINLKDYSLTNPENNINLGTWYLDHTHQEYDDNSLLAVASYNAGPGNVARWLKKYGLNDFDEFVENIPFAETRGYVESVFGNYWNYLRIYNPEISSLYQTRI